MAVRLVLLVLVLCGITAGIALWLRPSASAEHAAEVESVPTPLTPAEEFLRIGEGFYAGDDPQYGRAPREALESRIAELARGGQRDLALELRLSFEEIHAGSVLPAIQRLEHTLSAARQYHPGLARNLQRALALAWLRQAENENCLERHNADCCILPARPGAVHASRKPAQKARAIYRELLREEPTDLRARWLVNLTTLLLGESLEDLAPEERIPGQTFGAASGKAAFVNVAVEAGVSAGSLAGGVAVEDFDGDGWLDAITSTCDPLGPLQYFRSRGDGTFEDLSRSSRLAEQRGGLNLVSGDVDADGDQDVLVLRGGWLLEYGSVRNSLLRNEDEGRSFEDVTRAAGLAEPARPTQAAVFGDYDGDGTLDVYVGNESRLEIEEGGKGNHPSQLFLNNGRAVFHDVAPSAGVTNDRYAKGVAAGDYDADGDLDLYVSNIGFNRLYRNDGHSRFTDVATQAGVREPAGRSFACWFFDHDQDGLLDLWVNSYSSSISELTADALGRPHRGDTPRLFRNLGDGRFEDVSGPAGIRHPWLAMGANFGDPDGDGWLDVYLGTGDPDLTSLMPNVFLRNVAGRRFENRTVETGLGHLQKGHGIGFADFDGDGDQDLFHKLGGFVPVDTYPNVLFENRAPVVHRRLVVSLEGTRTNRDAVGAHVVVRLETPRGPRTLHRFPGCVSSFGGSPHRLEIGLGDATAIAALEIRWPRSAAPQVFQDVPLDAWVWIREGDERYEVRPQRSYRF